MEPTRAESHILTLEQILDQLGSLQTGVEQSSRRIELCKAALNLIDRNREPKLWGALQTLIGTTLILDLRDPYGKNIEGAITAFEHVLPVYTRTAMPIEWAMTTANLAIAYRHRIQGDRAENQERAIELYKEVLTVYRRDAVPKEWARIATTLADAYQDRLQGEQAENQERAIELYKQALTARTRDAMPEEWATTTHNLANAYQKWLRGDRAENLERSIQLYEQVLTVRTRDAMPTDWALTTHNLASAYENRIRGERAENLEHSIQLYEQVLTVRTPEAVAVDWAATTMGLAVAYQNRILGEQVMNHRRAIGLYEQALTVYSREAMPVEWASTIQNLASAHHSIREHRAEHQEKAIQLYSQALEVFTRDTMPLEWATTTVNLAGVYWDRIQGERAENQECAIELCNQALTAMTRDLIPMHWVMATMNLANLYEARIHGKKVQNQERAIQLYEQALAVYTKEGMPAEHRLIQIRLGNLFLDQMDWVRAAAAYQAAFEAHEIVYEVATTAQARLDEQGYVLGVSGRLAYALAAQKNPNLQHAVTVLERGRARSLAEALHLDQSLPEVINAADKVALKAARARIKELEAEGRLREGPAEPEAYVSLAQRLGKARTEMRQLVERIRSYAPQFLPAGDFKEIVDAAHQARLIYLAATLAGGIALSISAEAATVAIKPIFLPDLTENLLRQKVSSHLAAVQAWHLPLGNGELRQDALTALDESLKWVWDAVMKDVASQLSPQHVTVLIPSGLLGFLPLHAAWTEDTSTPTGRRYALDVGQIAYTPSARVLTSAVNRNSVLSDSILAIHEPRPTKASSLPNSIYEVQAALSYFDPARKTLLQHQEATRAKVMRACHEHSVLHFSCHGYANLLKPPESGLLMAHDEWLKVQDFLGMQLRAVQLAVLSACETGLPGAELPDEMIGLAAGLLQAGVAGVVGSMWSVSDASTMILLISA